MVEFTIYQHPSCRDVQKMVCSTIAITTVLRSQGHIGQVCVKPKFLEGFWTFFVNSSQVKSENFRLHISNALKLRASKFIINILLMQGSIIVCNLLCLVFHFFQPALLLSPPLKACPSSSSSPWPWPCTFSCAQPSLLKHKPAWKIFTIFTDLLLARVLSNEIERTSPQ